MDSPEITSIRFYDLIDPQKVEAVITLSDEAHWNFIRSFREALSPFRLHGITRKPERIRSGSLYEKDYLRINHLLTATPWEKFGLPEAAILIQALGCADESEIFSALPDFVELVLRSERYFYHYGFLIAYFLNTVRQNPVRVTKYPPRVRSELHSFFERMQKKFSEDPALGEDRVRINRLLERWPAR